MQYLKYNWIALTVLGFCLINELLHLAFKEILFLDKVLEDGSHKLIYYNAPVYYFTLALRSVVISVIILYFVWKSNLILRTKRESKSLITGAIVWNLIELYQEFCYIAKIDEKVLYFNDGLWGQLTFVVLIILLTYYSHANSK